MPNVTVDPIGKTCSPDPVSPSGANATITFAITPTAKQAGWQFASSNAIVINSPTPPAGMFTIPNPNSNGNIVLQDRNGDGKAYKYTVTCVNGTQTSIIDPIIQNDNE